ncbi:MAG: Na(+)/H(+) antiporter NhaA [Betaproteobacteria bacterium RIFCSPLOWO2_12_FULL_68_19]|nr:MAG: Na(+)/H(+) antiporter NhaA [Betaproteobacteria bacterium RIFCSPLOWO2_12_FULL_68_19]
MRPLAAIREFLALEAAGGVLLAGAALAAMACANSPLERWYAAFLETPLEVRAGAFEIAKPLLLWINDGLMAVFFFLVGLELKREAQEGELSRPSQVALPAVAAAGGMAAPAAIYAALNWNDPVTLHGWAIPAATDIAFALGVLSLLGPRVPGSLKVFLLTLAILDDLGAIVVIALFYTANLAPPSLAVAAAALAALAALNRSGVQRIAPYLLVGLVLWASVLKSGVHATLAGAALALFIPRRPARRLERDLHPPVAYGILPLFAFANAGVSLAGVSPGALLEPVPLGIAAGLLGGKLAGVFLASFAMIRAGAASLPEGAGWGGLLGVSLLCGIGFTMSLFISGLAFEGADGAYMAQARLGILLGSLASAAAGYAVLSAALRPSPR